MCAAPTINHFREQQDGAFALFTSTSGLIGNIGQANYAAAKLGIMGLSRVVAMEGAKYGVRSNIIAPVAWTRMTQSVPIRDEAQAKRREHMAATIRPDQPAKLAVALASPLSRDVSGQILGARGDVIELYSQPRTIMNLNKEGGWTPEGIATEAFGQMKEKFFPVARAATSPRPDGRRLHRACSGYQCDDLAALPVSSARRRSVPALVPCGGRAGSAHFSSRISRLRRNSTRFSQAVNRHHVGNPAHRLGVKPENSVVRSR